MSADFTPNMETYRNPHYFRFWCQKVLPLVYDDSLSYYELLCKVVNYLNDVIADSDAMKTNIGNLLIAYNELQEFVNNYFDNLDVQEEINNKLDQMAEDGTLSNLLSRFMADVIPVFVSSTAAMTDHSRVYVLTNNSHIYTSNGETFTDTGVIYGIASNAFTPSVLVAASNYQALGISSVADFQKNKAYSIGNTLTSEMVSGFPEDLYGKDFTLLTFRASVPADTGGYTGYICMYGSGSVSKTYTAFEYSNGNISPWTESGTDSTVFDGGDIVGPSNYDTLNIHTLTDFKPNRIYGIRSTITADMISGLPYYGLEATLEVIQAAAGNTTGYTNYIYRIGGNDFQFEWTTFSHSNGRTAPWLGIGLDKKFATCGVGGMFPTIQRAVNWVNDGGTVYVLPGTYEEQITVINKEVHIIGADKTGVKLIDRSGNYSTPPLEIAKGSVSNMTIIEESPIDGSDNTAYCVHADWDGSVGSSLLLENLILIDNCHACVGVGARDGFTFTMKNCELTQTGEHSTRSQRGTFYMHTFAGPEAGNGTLILIDNVIKSTENKALTLQRVASQNVGFTCELINNSMIAAGSVSDSIYVDGNNNPGTFDNTWIRKSAISHGNNLNILN